MEVCGEWSIWFGLIIYHDVLDYLKIRFKSARRDMYMIETSKICEEVLKSTTVSIAIDGQDQIYLLRPLRHDVVKVDQNGKVLWSCRIDELDQRFMYQLERRQGKAEINKKKGNRGFGVRTGIQGFTVTRAGVVLVTHLGGCVAVDEHGHMIGYVGKGIHSLFGPVRSCGDSLLCLFKMLADEEKSPIYSLFRNVDSQFKSGG